MESSRSGLLSTLLMTLPLIVVPAIALLRPPGGASGVSMSPLGAADAVEDEFQDDVFDPDSGEQQRDSRSRFAASDDSEEFDELFNQDESSINDMKQGNTSLPRSDGALRKELDSLNPFDSATEEAQVAGLNPAESIIQQLNSLGALRTMWFDAGADAPVGLAVFFRGQTDLMRIRFEAVGQSREECARNVFSQVTRWQADQAQNVE